LPGGLIMLCQLVCVDRRYQRMNCFNIRELQGNLKRKFFSDLVNSNDHREILSNSMIGLRFKANNTLNLNHDVMSFYQFGTNLTPKSRNTILENTYTNSLSIELDKLNNTVTNLFLTLTHKKPFNYLVVSVQEIFIIFLSIFFNVKLFVTFTFKTFYFNLTNLNLNIFNFGFFYNHNFELNLTKYNNKYNSSVTFFSDNSASTISSLYTGLENSNYQRSNRFYNSFVSYDYKTGNYIGT